MNEREVLQALAAIAQESRLRVFRFLVVAGHEGATPGRLAEDLDIPASSLSFHLKELSNAGLVSARRDGRSLYYSARFDTMNALLGYLTDNCCEGAACRDDAAAKCVC